MSLPQLDWATTPLQGSTMVQAGAGSGKTYAIMQLYLRLLLQLPPDKRDVRNILVLTFTRAATAELQTRIRRLLADSLQHLQNGQAIPGLPQAMAADTNAAAIVRYAVQSMDEAAIFTIHGFCKHVLEEYSFACGQPSGVELTGEEDSIVVQIAEDYWRGLYQQDQFFISYLRQHYQQPMDMYQQLQRYIGQPDLDVATAQPLPQEQQRQLLQNLQQAHAGASEIWRQQRQDIIGILHGDALNRNKYRVTSLPGWFAAMDNLLSYPPTATPLFERFERFCTSGIVAATKKQKSPPSHSFFATCEQLQQLHHDAVQDCAARFSQWQKGFIEYADAERRQRSLKGGVMGYHDLLLRLHQALNGPRGQSLARQLRQRFPAALIDEFQDTDQLQYQIFSKIYDDGEEQSLFYVGDPKQAIYGFRGADIFSYIKASSIAAHKKGLGINYRSHPDLVAAVNTIFSQSDTPFALSEIDYAPLQPKHRPEDRSATINGKPLPPISIWTMDQMPSNRFQAERWIAASCAARIAHLLHPDNQCLVQGRPLTAADVAVLVERHGQGDLMRQALAGHGVVAVSQRYQSVYATEMATQLSILLHAILHQDDYAICNAAAASMLLGHDATWLQQHGQDAAASVHQWHGIWQQRGFMPMMQHIMREAGVAARVLATEDGQQHLTDLLHLGELLQSASHSQPDPAALLRLLDQAKAASASDNSEHHRRRLQSDDNLVQIVTVHVSKGLEYAITFCPFHWASIRTDQAKPPLFYHQEKEQGYRATLQLDRQQCDDSTQLRRSTEQLSEKLRLFYVSLTRASCHCTMVYAPPAENKANIFSTLLPRGIPPELQQFASPLPEPEQTQPLPRQQRQRPSTGPLKLTAAIASPQRIESFTSLSRHGNAELPDYDNAAANTMTEETASGFNVHTLPAGATTGICLHSILERTNFGKGPDLALIKQQLQLHGIGSHWANVVQQIVHNTLTTPLFKQQLQLKSIAPSQCINEMEFIYPVCNISSDGLLKAIGKHLDQPTASALQKLKFIDISGYLRGFIDLVFTDGQHTWLIDYKSNRLGGSADGYSQERIKQAVLRENYSLQYLIYSLALHRMLRLRIKDYDYQSHHGGACYLFLRGLNNGDNGIFHHKPPVALIEELDSYVGGG